MTPKPTQPTAAKNQDKNLRSDLTLSIPTTLLAAIDVFALQAGLSRADTIEKILTACTFQEPAPAPKPPRPCPRGHIRPCERKQPPISKPS